MCSLRATATKRDSRFASVQVRILPNDHSIGIPPCFQAARYVDSLNFMCDRTELCLRYSVFPVCNQLADAFDRGLAAFQNLGRAADRQTLFAAADDIINSLLADSATELFAF